MLDHVKVDYYGTDTPVGQMGQVSTPEPTLILVQPYDAGMVSAIEKAIRTSGTGLNPMSDGKVIRVPVPPMTEERRKDVVKQLNKTLEDHKTAIRNIRRDGNDQIKKAAKDKLISADDEKRANDEVQQLTDAEIKRIEELCKAKEKEIMTVRSELATRATARGARLPSRLTAFGARNKGRARFARPFSFVRRSFRRPGRRSR